MTQSRIQEALVAWLAEAVFRFSVAVHVEKLTPESIEMSFEGVSTAVGAIVKYEEIEPFVELEVFVDWEGSNWDLILNLDCEPVRQADGYVCDLCAPKDQKVFPSCEALWRDHLFEPFLEWINDKLAQSDVIGLYRSGGMTRAALLRSSTMPEDDQPSICVPLWL